MRKSAILFRTYCPAVSMLCVAVLFSAGLLVTKNAGAVGLQAVAVFPPWFSERQSFTSVALTGAPIAAPGPFDWMVVAIPQSAQQSRSLKSSNALFLPQCRICTVVRYRPARPQTIGGTTGRMKPSFLNNFWVDVSALNVQRLRQAVSWILVWYFWLAAAIAVIASYLTGGSVLFVALPLALIGAVTTATVMADASALAHAADRDRRDQFHMDVRALRRLRHPQWRVYA